MHTIELTDEELRFLHAPLHAYPDDFGGNQYNLARASRLVRGQRRGAGVRD